MFWKAYQGVHTIYSRRVVEKGDRGKTIQKVHRFIIFDVALEIE